MLGSGQEPTGSADVSACPDRLSARLALPRGNRACGAGDMAFTGPSLNPPWKLGDRFLAGQDPRHLINPSEPRVRPIAGLHIQLGEMKNT